MKTKHHCYPLLNNVHLELHPPTANGKSYIIQGDFTYYHYNCDNYDDVGWGCAYRTLQSACSWIGGILNANEHDKLNQQTPSIPDIQDTLVRIGDKPETFFGSGEWIGALEVFFVIDTLYDVSCKILHIPESEDLKKYATVLKKYFEDFGGLAMMGGDIDASSKGIAGIHISGNQAYLLVIDPHFIGKANSAEELIELGYIRWQHTSEFIDSSFYNICLPQIKAQNLK